MPHTFISCGRFYAFLASPKPAFVPVFDKCGAPGIRRELSPNNIRKKAGRKTDSQRLSYKLFGCWGESIQPGMSTIWRFKIISADKLIPTPKPPMTERYTRIIADQFSNAMRIDDNGNIVAVELKKGQYPNYAQVKRVLTSGIGDIELIREKTTKGHSVASSNSRRSNWSLSVACLWPRRPKTWTFTRTCCASGCVS